MLIWPGRPSFEHTNPGRGDAIRSRFPSKPQALPVLTLTCLGVREKAPSALSWVRALERVHIVSEEEVSTWRKHVKRAKPAAEDATQLPGITT